MKLSDYVMNYIADLGVKDVFYLPGGGAMHLDNSLGSCERLNCVCMLHEQAASIAAESYARISQNYGACVVTSGPGSTNAVTGLAGAWLDGTPVIFISGQVKRADLAGNQGIRQFGIQEVDITSVVKPLTKYAVRVDNPDDIRFELEKASFLAKDGKPGPVWIDIPLDVQTADIDEKSLKGYDCNPVNCEPDRKLVEKAVELFLQSEKPVVLLGNGIRLSGAADFVERFVDELNCPTVTTWNGADLIEDSHPLYFGRPGAVGQRYANIIQQKSDYFLTIGTRLNLLSTGFDYDTFVRNAKHVMVEIDENEMKKKSVHPDVAVLSDAGLFMKAFLECLSDKRKPDREKWIGQCRRIKEKYPLFIPEQKPSEGYISTYDLINEITGQMNENDIYQFTSSGTAADIAMQTFRFKKGQRGFLTKGLASMGFDLPAAMGSCIASGGKRVVCATGDGGFMMNIQELAVLHRLNLPVKMFIVSNEGYGMIYNSQFGNFKGHLTGCTEGSGLFLPDIAKVADAFGIKSFEIKSADELSVKVGEVLNCDGPAVSTVKVDIAQKILPRQTNYMKADGNMASRPLEDLSPLLPEEELESVMKE